MKKLNITFCSFPDFAGNAKALYEYMVDAYKDKMNYTWIVYNEQSVQRLKKIGIDAILIGSSEFKEYIPKTNVFFTTQGNLDGDKVKCEDAIYIELWHGIGPKPTGFSQHHPSEQDKKGYANISEIVDYFIVPSKFWEVVYGATFKVEASRIKSFGMPLLDYFNDSNGRYNLEKVLNKDLSSYKKIIIYMPTFKQGFNHFDVMSITNNIFNFKEGYDESKLEKFLKKNNYLLCVKKHPGEEGKINFFNSENILNIEESMLLNNNVSVNEIINAFDLLITDYSSIGTEFIYLERPVLFAAGDIDEYEKNRGILFGSYDMWTPGPVCSNINSLMNELKKLLEDNSYFSSERKRFKKIWFGDIKDGGCDRICNFLFDSNGKISANVERYKSPIVNLQMENDKLNKIINRYKVKIKDQKERIEYLQSKEQELASIKHSRSYRILQKIIKIIKKSKKIIWSIAH